jgi:hypothetical protein
MGAWGLMLKGTTVGLLVAGCFAAAPVEAETPGMPQQASAPASPVAAASDPGLEAIPSPEGLTMPRLDFAAAADVEEDFDKYFYFHREGTSFAEAYADIRECDALASGSSIYMGGYEPYPGFYGAQYGIGGAIGGAIGSAIADAVFGSAARRQQRRVNLRNCMSFKQYKRYGLPRDLWTEFNFEEGLGRKREPVRLRALALQALVASGPKPKTKELGL